MHYGELKNVILLMVRGYGCPCSSPAAATTVRIASSRKPGTSATAGPLRRKRSGRSMPSWISPMWAVCHSWAETPLNRKTSGHCCPCCAASGKIPAKSIWCYTGYQLEELLTPGAHPHCEATEEMLSCIDILIDGRFIPEEKDISLQFRGSRNQRVIDMNRTRQSGKITPWDKLRK